MKKKLDVVIVGHDPDYCRFLGLSVEFLRSSPSIYFLEKLNPLWGYKPEHYSTIGGRVGSTFFGSVPCELIFEDYRFRSSHRTIGQLCHALKELKTEVTTLDINEIGWYYQGRESRIFTQPLNAQGLPILQRHPEYKEEQKEAFLRSLEGTIKVHEAENQYVMCPTTGRKLNPNTLLPIEEHIDFNNRSVLC